LEIGRGILEARAAGQDPVRAACRALGGWLLFRGTVASKEWASVDGYMIGSIHLSGHGEFDGTSARIWFKNENHVLWVDEQPRAMSPDLIMVVVEENAEPQTNTALAEGKQVAVLGCRANERFHYGKPLAEMEPRHYGMDLTYEPLDVLIARTGGCY
jgi:DUF917 family protein